MPRNWRVRLCWLGAWCLWATSGWWLFLALPRGPSPLIAKLNLQGSHVLQELPDGRGFLTTHRAEPGFQSVNVHRFPDGAVQCSYRVKAPEDAWFGGLRDGWLVAHNNFHKCVFPGQPVALELATGRTVALEAPLGSTITSGDLPSGPWALAAAGMEGSRINDAPVRVGDLLVACDLATGKALGELRGPEPQRPTLHFLAARAAPGTDFLVLEVVEPGTPGGEVPAIEVWRVPIRKQPLHRLPDASLELAAFSRTGRLATLRKRDATVAVHDLASGRELLRVAAGVVERTEPILPNGPWIRLSHDGRTLAIGARRCTLDVDTGRVLFRAPPDVPYFHFSDNGSEASWGRYPRDYPMIEKWNELIGGHWPAMRFPPCGMTVVDARTGALRRRCGGLDEEERDFRLYDSDSGYEVYGRSSPSWGLWSLGTGLLASPLLSFWLWGVWRRSLRAASIPSAA